MSNSTNSVTTSTGTTASARYTGRVKWFNNKAGYGFVTVTDGPKSGSDVFVHHSSIQVDAEQYKYLVQGEYVEFTLSDTPSSDHEYQAAEVCGIKGGKLMCETRRDVKVARSQYRTSKFEQTPEVSQPVQMPKAVRAPRSQQQQPQVKARGQGPRDDREWTYVAKTRKNLPEQDQSQQSQQSQTQARRTSGGRGQGRRQTSAQESR